MPSKNHTSDNSLSPTSEIRPAPLFRRLMAILYDGFLLLGICFAFGVLVLTIRRILGHDTMMAQGVLGQTITLLGMWASCAFFYVWCWRRSGQTLGMKSWRLKVQSPEGHTPSWQSCWLRCLLAPLSLATCGIGYLWCLVDKQGDCLHDKWSGTQTLLMPKIKMPIAKTEKLIAKTKKPNK